MNTRNLLIASAAALLPMTAALADDPPASASSDATATAVATLKDKVGKRSDVEVDEVRVTDSGAACIKYRVRNNLGGASREHAVVKGDEVERSTMGNKGFEKAWNDNCLGPRGGMTPAQ